MDINKIKQKIYTLYDEDNLKKLKYNLHSVCIHEGNAASGHFWTYIWNTQQKKWFKFNDTDVSESNWDDLYANAVGGGITTTSSNKNIDSTNNENIKNENVNYQKNNINIGSNLNNMSKSISNDRSAYFLVYTSGDDSNLYQEYHDLDADLVKLLEDDQEALENQLNTFKLKQILKEMNENLKRSNLSLANAGVTSNICLIICFIPKFEI
jgi:ubiquitin carboxyl-terminal hydrolase 25/28